MRYLFIILFTFISVLSQAANLDPEMEKLIQQRIDERWQQLLESDEFKNKVREGILAFIDEQKPDEGNPANVRVVDPEKDHIKGDPKAPLTLVEYSDFECPFCKRFHETMVKVTDKYSQVNWVYRHFPLDMHNPGAQKQSEASECVAELGGNDKFWEFTDAIYERTRSNGHGFPLDQLAPLAKEIGVDGSAFQDCYDSGKYRQKVLDDTQNGMEAGVTGTPKTFLIHHESGAVVPINGAQPFETIDKMLTEMIEKLNL
ncbi:DsbA family protein [Gynuella sunshinyii]|uniref:Protein-disulfide isomerase n=1 Tax=Gynuella sunshinyii YC6258 TaxID=1445510 RepID=A0A0C5UY55_9GAMM|nr:DsbA family protein [Gynuella sunshinyii]AJQ92215.1 protein-disulfide isomerase [Gynuella sunshinyii YC6258]